MFRRVIFKIISKPSRLNYSTSIDNNEIQHFSQFTSTWWDPNGPTRLLLLMNKVRVPFIKERIEYAMKNSTNSNFPKRLEDVKLLEIGCGGGVLSEALAGLKMQVTGIDMAEDLIKIAQNHALNNDKLKNLSYVYTKAEDFCNNHKNHFDVLVASELVEHVSNLEYFLNETLKGLKPGGSLIITTINKTFLAKVYAILLLEGLKIIPRGTHTYEKLVSPSLLKTILEKNSCYIKKIQGVRYNFITDSFSFSKNTSIFYGLHAIKEK